MKRYNHKSLLSCNHVWHINNMSMIAKSLEELIEKIKLCNNGYWIKNDEKKLLDSENNSIFICSKCERNNIFQAVYHENFIKTNKFKILEV